ncbi:hypothetical protein ACQUY5_16650 [Bacillus cereus]|uniref:hypothetical protein n=1 Tax=Bacillus cereus TaxID=1396 RepID=UPI003D17B27C
MIEFKHVRVAKDRITNNYVLDDGGHILLHTEERSVLLHWCELLEIVIPTHGTTTNIDSVNIRTHKSDIVVTHKEFRDKEEIPTGAKPCITILNMRDCDEYMEVIAYIHINGLNRTIYIPVEESDSFVELYTDYVQSTEVLPFLNFNFRRKQEVY